VNLLVAFFIVVFAVALVCGAMLMVRRRAPEGIFILDADRASAIFGFLGTALSILLAFVIFLSLETYNGAKSDSLEEADSVLEQFEIAGLLAPPDRVNVQGQLMCYARGVINDEWPLMAKGKRSAIVDEWVANIETTVDKATVEGSKQQTGVDKFFDETLEREKGRRGRLIESQGVVPTPMWIMLFVGCFCLIGYVLLLASSKERALVQFIQVGGVTAFIVISLLLVNFLDHPFRDGTGSLQPSSMRFGLAEMMRAGGSALTPPCDATGHPK
jgi:amino acid transporter